MATLKNRISAAIGSALGVKISSQASHQNLLRELDFFKHQLLEAQAVHARPVVIDNSATLRAELEAMRNANANASALLNNLASAVGRMAAQLNPRRRKAGKPTVFVHLSEITQLPHLRALFIDKKPFESYDFVVFSEINHNASMSEILEFCRSLNIPFFSRFDLLLGGIKYVRFMEAESAISNFSHRLDFTHVAAEEFGSVAATDAILAEVRRIDVYAKSVKRVLEASGADLLMIFEENAATESGVWPVVAKSLGIGTVITPITIADQIEPAEAYYRDPNFCLQPTGIDQIILQRFPHWFYEYKGSVVRRRLALTLLALETLGYAQPLPWVLNSSRGDILAAESPSMVAHYTKLGIPESQMQLTGSFIDDRLFIASKKRAELAEDLNIDMRKPLLLCAFPSNQAIYNRPNFEFSSYRDMIDFWLGSLREINNWEVVIKPHPGIPGDDVDYLRKFGIPVITADTADLVPLCDLYCTSVSSTIRWALGCGKPVLNYDVYHFNYKDFCDESAVMHVSSASAFQQALSNMVAPGGLDVLKNRAIHAVKRWGMVDGHSRDRIFAVFNSLIGPDETRSNGNVGVTRGYRE